MSEEVKTSKSRTIARVALGAVLAGAGVAHITVAREPVMRRTAELVGEAVAAAG